ncbi:MAG: hypothetical protein U0935_15580 [Pirellulales bacterium]
MRRLLLCVAFWSACVAGVAGGEIGFVEDFSLAPDRTVPLKQLIPGTEDYYYYHALHLLHSEQFEKVRELLGPWVQRHNRTPRVVEIETRLALLTYSQDPQKTLDFLRRRLNLPFNHQREIVGAAPDLPTALDPQLIQREALLQRTWQQNPLLNGLEDSALDWLVAQPMPPDRRRHLLQRLTRPDYPQLPKLVIEDLQHANSPGFGAFGIHRQLLLSQLDECLKLMPDLLNQGNFVQIYLTKLQPAPDDDWRRDAAVREAYLERLAKFVDRLAPVHNSLKAHVLYHRLAADRAKGVWDRARFLSYLKLPRPLPYVSRKFLELEDSRRFPADLNADYSGGTLLPPIGGDEPLVREYLAHFLVDANDTREFEPYVDDTYLKQLFAETKIVHGLGEPERWASALPPEVFQQLKERVDIDFVATNRSHYAADEPVTLDVFVKNVPTLIVKVFEINAQNYYRAQLREVDTDINLDGLVANSEQTHAYPEPALRRVVRRFEFPQLKKPGIYVIDFIGNGRSSRALIRKGSLRHVVRTSPFGQRFTVLDEQNRPVRDARLWLGGKEYGPQEDGTILVPFSTEPGRRPIVLSRGDIASLDAFQHEAENYSLTAGIYVDRESLLTRRKAQVVIRPGVFLNGTAVSVTALEDVRLMIVSSDHDQVPTAQEIGGVKLFEDRETTHEFQVPQRLQAIQFTLHARVSSRSLGKKIDLTAQQSFNVNAIDRSEKIDDLQLIKIGTQYALELRGRTGEFKAGRPVQLALKHRDFQAPINATLKTDGKGRVQLGALTDIATVTATGPGGESHSWPLRKDEYTYPQTLHGRTGETLALPLLNASGAEPSRGDLSLLELRGETYVADRFAALSVKQGLLQISQLPPGDFDLWIKSTGARVRIRIVTGEKVGNYVLGEVRQLETGALPPLQVETIAVGPENVTIQLRNASKFARVHVLGTRYVPAFDVFRLLSAVRASEPYLFLPGRAESVYVTGRNIGDEYRYILDRKYARKFPGNTLDRPSLLLNPWALRSTETGMIVAAGGDAFGAKGTRQESAAGRGAGEGAGVAGAADFANLDYLAQSASVLLNLTPNAAGAVVVPRQALGTHQHIHVVAIDPLQTICRSLSLEEPEVDILDLRLAQGLDPQAHFTQQKQISVVTAGQPFVLEDVTSSRLEVYDSLARVYGLYTTLYKDPQLAEFRFLLEWPKLKPEEKRAKYSQYACHELNFFLARKDPEFFGAVVKPYLAHKKDKTFLDRWLLQEDLAAFAQPWKHGQLNIVERILLAHRLAGERPRTQRHVLDLWSTLPPNVDQFIRLFDTAVRGSELESSDRLGVALEEKQAEQLRFAMPAPAAKDAGNASPPAPAAEPATAAVESPARPAGPQAVMLKRMAERDAAVRELAESEQLSRAGKAVDARRKSRDRAAGAQDEKKAQAEDYLFEQAGDKVSGESLRQLYRKLDPTMEWAENNYHHLPIDQQVAGLITVNAFWRDFAAHDPAQPFLSRNFAEASRNFSEIMLALAVLDLPFEAAAHETKVEGRRLTLVPKTSLIAFHEEVRPAKAPAGAAPILVSQNFFRHGDRHRQENGEQVDKYVTEEFLIHTVYGCQVVVTNPTSSRQKLSVLLQVPVGAIPVLNSQMTKTVYLTLEPYHTQTLEYHFYFPLPGTLAHFPVHVARNEELVASTAPFTFKVVAEPTQVDAQSWDYISQQGTSEDVLTFLARNNVQQLNLDRIAFRMKDKAFFEATLRLLAERHLYQPTLWSYGLLHNSVPAAREFLQHTDALVAECGGRLESPLLVIDPVARRSYEHLEYKPLVNARTHALGKRRQIVNDRLHGQYHALLRQLSYQRTLTDDDRLAVTYYLLLQDRVAEALEMFGQVRAEQVATRLQYDYCAAYLAFFTEDTKTARAIAKKYAEHPVDRWRNTFAAVLAQLDEAEGQGAAVVDAEDRTQQQTRLAATEPNLDLKVEGRQVTVTYQNLKSARVNFYVMDVELLFSRNPFVQQFGGQFAAIRPNHSQEVALPENQSVVTLPLPAELANRNVLVEVVSGGQTKSQAYYSNSLNVQIVENYGQVRVTHATTGKPVPKVYVKVYARTATGEVKFYKDGYTDLRGRFEYASLSTNDLETAARFSILVLSEEFGAAVREAGVPQR